VRVSRAAAGDRSPETLALAALPVPDDGPAGISAFLLAAFPVPDDGPVGY
jgi:hypothetical protein